VLDDQHPERSPVYQAMIKAGVSQNDAKQYIATEAAKVAGAGAGVVDAATNMAEGPILGRIISEGGPIVSRVGKGILTEGVQEGVQGAGEQVSQNEATREYLDPKQKLGEGVAENVIASFAVGGLTGGTFSAAGGHGMPHEAPLHRSACARRSAQRRHHARGRGEPAPDRPDRRGQDDDGRGRGDQGQPGACAKPACPTSAPASSVSHNGRTQQGAVADAWTLDVAGQSSTGIKIRLDDGTMIEEPLGTLHDMGVTIKPEQLPDGLAGRDLADPVVQQFAGEGMATVRALEMPLRAQSRKGRLQPLNPLRKRLAQPTGPICPKTSFKVWCAPASPSMSPVAPRLASSRKRMAATRPRSIRRRARSGLGQWLGSRKDELFRRYGPNPTRAQQIEFLAYELKGGDPGGKSVLSATRTRKTRSTATSRISCARSGQGDVRRPRARPCGAWREAGHAGRYVRRAAAHRDRDRREARGRCVRHRRERRHPRRHDGRDRHRPCRAFDRKRQGDERHVEYHGQQLGSMLGTTITAAEAPDYARAVLERFGDARTAMRFLGDRDHDEYTAFADHTGTLGIPRAEMPQIKAEHRGAMVNFLNARGISHQEETVPRMR
jgi:hypothetical protein